MFTFGGRHEARDIRGSDNRTSRKPWAFKWWLEFHPEAEDGEPGAAEALKAEADRIAEVMKRSLRSRPGPGLNAN